MYCRSSGPTDSRMYLKWPMIGKLRRIACFVCTRSYTVTNSRNARNPQTQGKAASTCGGNSRMTPSYFSRPAGAADPPAHCVPIAAAPTPAWE